MDGQVSIATTRGTITRLLVEPDSETASPAALAAIHHADQIILGPGSLFTSVLSALIVQGIVDAIESSNAQLVFVANLTTQDGETFHLDGPGHVEALSRIAGLEKTGVIVANGAAIDVPDPIRRLEYPAEQIEALGWRLVERNLADTGATWPQHDSITLGATLAELA